MSIDSQDSFPAVMESESVPSMTSEQAIQSILISPCGNGRGQLLCHFMCQCPARFPSEAMRYRKSLAVKELRLYDGSRAAVPQPTLMPANQASSPRFPAAVGKEQSAAAVRTLPEKGQ
jgi:hypothetical protein